MKPLAGAVVILGASIFFFAACYASSAPHVPQFAVPIGYVVSLVCGLLGLMLLASRPDEPPKS
jgi:hypothetical protein